MASGEGPYFCMGDENEMRFWRMERLWELARKLPVEALPIKDLLPLLEEDHWFGGLKATCVRVAQHAKQIYEVDLSYPIILSSEGVIMDGWHRLTKAWLLGLETLPAVRFAVDPEPDYIRTKDQQAPDPADGSPIPR